MQVYAAKRLDPAVPHADHCSVVGMSLRYPGLQSFWQQAVQSTDVQQGVPYSRWNNDERYSPDLRPGKMTTSTRYPPLH